MAAFDYGIKYNILRHLERIGAEVLVLPAKATAEEVLRLNPDGDLPFQRTGRPVSGDLRRGDHQGSYRAKAHLRHLPGPPAPGATALGGTTYKLKFGHRGGNQPVKDLTTGRVEITAQNHGYCVDLDTLDQDAVELTHVNLNDNTLEGFRHRSLPLFCVQYHPENSPGPHDATYLFDRFAELDDSGKVREA